MLPAFMRKYGVTLSGAYVISIPIIKRGAIDYAVSSDWTPAEGDVRVRKDGGAWASLSTIANITASSAGGNGVSATWDVVLTGTELQAKRVDVMISDAATKMIEDQFFVIETYGHASAMYPSDPGANNIDQETRFLAAAKGIVYGTVGNSGTNTTTKLYITGGAGTCSPAPTAADQFKGRVLIFADDTTTTALRGQGFPISGNTTTDISCDAGNALTTAPVNGDAFTIT